MSWGNLWISFHTCTFLSCLGWMLVYQGFVVNLVSFNQITDDSDK